jgi:hypothetical protein
MARGGRMSRAILILAVLLIVSISFNLVLVVEMASGQSIQSGLGAENHAIQNVSNLVSMIAAIVGAIGLLVGVDQLRQSKDQARAQAIYNVLKDSRESTSVAPADWFTFYYAVFEQKRLGVFSDDMWEPVRRDIAKMLATPAGQTYWTQNKANFSGEFRDELKTIPGGS